MRMDIVNLCIFASLIPGIYSDVIDTIPSLPNNTLATGYSNLIVNAQFTSPAFQPCDWYYEGTRIIPSFWSSGASGFVCNPSNNGKYEISCNDLGNELASNFTIFENINNGTLDASVYCNGRPLLTLPTITVQDCIRTISNDVVVEADTYQQNDTGRFSCTNNGTLFTSDGNKLSSPETTCQDTAKWSNEDSVQCWTAPSVTLSGDLNVKKGNNLTLNCDYTDVIPIGSSSIFYVGDVAYTKPKLEPLVLTLQPSDTDKIVSCQALTPYTMKPEFNNTGRSVSKTINVTYAPYQEAQASCSWIVNQTDVCLVEFFSNPLSEFVSLTLDGAPVANDGSNNIMATNDKQTFYFIRNLVTNADNGMYQLMLQSSVLSNAASIFFNINAVEGLSTQPPCTTSNNQAFIIVFCCALVLLAILIAIFVYISVTKLRQPKGNCNEIIGSSNNVQLMNDAVQTDYINQQPVMNQTPSYEVVSSPITTGEGPYENELTTSSTNLASRNTSYANTGFEEDKDGYLAVNGHNSRVHTSNISVGSAISSASVSLPTDKYGYIDLNNQTTGTTSEYEIIDSRQQERK